MSDPLILIVDDNEPTRQLMVGILGSVGYTTMQAIDGGSALKVVQDFDVACVVIDQYMEPMGGFEFAQHFQLNEIQPPRMIMITAHETSDLLTKSQALGFSQVLQKPVVPDRLVTAVERALR